jgi:hypothetical protein
MNEHENEHENEGEFTFDIGDEFEQGELGGNVSLGKFEEQYEELFAEVIEDGIITADERARLDRAADALGLDRQRLYKLEQALQAAYEARHQVKIRDLSTDAEPVPSLRLRGAIPSAGPLPSIMVPAGAPSEDVLGMQLRIAELEARVAELEVQLEDARAQIAVVVDVSDTASAPAQAAPDDDPADLQRRLRADPRDTDALRALYGVWTRQNNLDRRWTTAQALVFRGAASDEQRALFEQHRPEGLIRPATSVSLESWRRLLFHPDEEVLTGEIFSVIVPAVLLGRVAALRRDKALPQLDPAAKQDPAKSTLQAVRCFSWASSLLSMTAPTFFADPSYAGLVEMVPGLPPVSRLGKQALSGRSAGELAFLAGRHLSWYRAEHFVRLLVRSIPDLEDLFMTALIIANPSIPLGADMKRRVQPLARAIEPILEPTHIDLLRALFKRFLEEGGRTNLQRWATAADRTASRAGLLLCNDFEAARAMLQLEEPSEADERLDDLVVFVTSDRYAGLRQQIGVALGG